MAASGTRRTVTAYINSYNIVRRV